MSNHEEAVLVPYAPEEMFDLVADIERYPEFVPGYKEASVLARSGDRLVASQRVGFGAITAVFRSEAQLERPRRIRIRSMESPFDSLHIEWLFTPADGGCRITFRAQVQMSASLTARLLQPWLDRLAELVPPAFVARARVRYGQREGPGPT